MLQIGDEIEVFKYRRIAYKKTIYKPLGKAKVFAIHEKFIVLDFGLYKDTIYMMDLRQGTYILKKDGQEVIFKKAVDFMKVEELKIKKELEEYRQTTGKASYKSMNHNKNVEEGSDMGRVKITEEQLIQELEVSGFNNKSYERIADKYGIEDPHSVACKVSKLRLKDKMAVKLESETMVVKKGELAPVSKINKADLLAMRASGKSVEEIVEFYKPSYPNCKVGMLKAKIVLILSGKKTGMATKAEKAVKQQEGADTCGQCVYGIGTGSGEDLNCHEGKNNNPVKKNTFACSKFINVSDIISHEAHVDGVGHFTDERCPKCGAHLLKNNRGEKWCSLVGCDYGLKKSVETQDHVETTESDREVVPVQTINESQSAFVGHYIDQASSIVETEEYPELKEAANQIQESIMRNIKPLPVYEDEEFGAVNLDEVVMNEIKQVIKPVRHKLKPKSLISQDVNGLEYDLMAYHLEIVGEQGKLQIGWEDLNNFIADLQEIQENAGA